MPHIIPPVLVGLLLLLMLPVTIFGPGTPMTPEPYQWFGIPIVLIGVAVLRTGHGRFVSEQTEIHTFRTPTILVSDGIYGVTRNPMYLGFLLILLGVALCTNEMLNGLFVVVFFLAAQFWYIPFEERNAAKAFGEAYVDYKSRVRRWL